MILTKHRNIDLYSWPLLEKLGVKAGCAAGRNFALHAPAGVPEKEILEARKRLSLILDADSAAWICGDQIHSAEVTAIRAEAAGRGALNAADALPSCDGLFLNDKGLQGMIFTADCLPLVLYDREKMVGSLVHAGWRGAAAGIVPAALEKMLNAGSRIQNIMAAAGPAISSCCYQVDAPVYKAMTGAFPECKASFSPDIPVNGESRWRFNLEDAVFRQLDRRGLPRENREGSGLCSCCGPAALESYRRSGPRAGRMATFLITPGSPRTQNS